jgi:hypothetical protein
MRTLGSLRRLLLGETWTIPLGIAAALALAILVRSLLPRADWQTIGGFVLAGALIVTLIGSLGRDHARAPARDTPPRGAQVDALAMGPDRARDHHHAGHRPAPSAPLRRPGHQLSRSP